MLKHLMPIVTRMDANVTRQRFEVVKANDKPGWYRLRDEDTGRTLLALYASRGAARAAIGRAKLTYCRECDREMPLSSVAVRRVVGCGASGHRRSVVDATVRCAGCGHLREMPPVDEPICNN